MITYNFAEKFATEPGPRFKNLGENSGEKFREEVLDGVFASDEAIEIDVTGVILSFGPSFLSESFGKVAVQNGKQRFYSLIKFKDDNESNKRFKIKVEKYVDNALKKAE